MGVGNERARTNFDFKIKKEKLAHKNIFLFGLAVKANNILSVTNRH